MGTPLSASLIARRVVDRLFFPEAPLERQWCRLVMNDEIAKVIAGLPPAECEAVEISGSHHAAHPWRSYQRLAYPDFDICSSAPERSYDVVLCEQVLEHVRDPWAAVRNLRDLCRPGGHVIVSTPFLVRVHNEPADYWRFTAPGMRLLLERAGLDVLSVDTWGNRACVRANLRNWVNRRPWQSLANEEPYPLVVWAVARRPAEDGR